MRIIFLILALSKLSSETFLLFPLRSVCDLANQEYELTFGVSRLDSSTEKTAMLQPSDRSLVSSSRPFNGLLSDKYIISELEFDDEVWLGDNKKTNYFTVDEYTYSELDSSSRKNSLTTFYYFECAKLTVHECYPFDSDISLTYEQKSCGLFTYLTQEQTPQKGFFIFILKDQIRGENPEVVVNYPWVSEKFRYLPISEETEVYLFSSVWSFSPFTVSYKGRNHTHSVRRARRNFKALVHEDADMIIFFQPYQSYARISTEIWNIAVILMNTRVSCFPEMTTFELHLVPDDEGDPASYFSTTLNGVDTCNFNHLWRIQVEIPSYVQSFHVIPSIAILDMRSKPTTFTKHVFPPSAVSSPKIEIPFSSSIDGHLLHILPISDSVEPVAQESDFTLVMFTTQFIQESIKYSHFSSSVQTCSEKDLSMLSGRQYVHLTKSSADHYMFRFNKYSWHAVYSTTEKSYGIIQPNASKNWLVVWSFHPGKLTDEQISALPVPDKIRTYDPSAQRI